MPHIFVDTGAWYALPDISDANHRAAAKFKDSLARPLMTSNYVVDAVITLVRNRLGYKVAIDIGQKLWGKSIANLIRVMLRDEIKAWDVFVQYCDKNLSFTDCTSFALVKRIGITAVFAFDEHFKQHGSFIGLPLARRMYLSRAGVGNGDR
ncbi:VapC toxin family PIN domain ribonuclease [Methanosarcinales archaeon]|nr:MAG: VapC toxin family PIN domain ribonuclease [Methanosarcinales archaeon]